MAVGCCPASHAGRRQAQATNREEGSVALTPPQRHMWRWLLLCCLLLAFSPANELACKIPNMVMAREDMVERREEEEHRVDSSEWSAVFCRGLFAKVDQLLPAGNLPPRPLCRHVCSQSAMRDGQNLSGQFRTYIEQLNKSSTQICSFIILGLTWHLVNNIRTADELYILNFITPSDPYYLSEI